MVAINLFSFLSVVFFMTLSSLPFLMYWASSEKKFPFYSQKKSAYFYLMVVFFLSLVITISSVLFDGLDLYRQITLDTVVNKASHISQFFSSDFISHSNSLFILDSISSGARILILVSSIVASLGGYYYSNLIRYNQFEFCFYLLFSTLAMLLLVSSNHGLMAYIAVELQSLSFYLMASSQRKSLHSVEAGLKYLFIGSLASGALLMGLAMIYFVTGTVDFSNLTLFYTAYNSVDYPLYSFATLNLLGGPALVLFAFLIKLGVAPFHMWVADVYEGSPTSATAYFLLVPKIAYLVIFFRITASVFGMPNPNFDIFSGFLLFVSLSSFIFGYIGLLRRGINLKRFFAFSGIGHLGFLMLMFALPGDLATFSLTGDRTIGSIFTYLIIYIISTIPSISLLVTFTHKTNYSVGRRNSSIIDNLPNMYHLFNPTHALFVFLLFSAFIGIPPTGGFYLKLFPLLATLSDNSLLVLIIIWALVVLSSFVYAKVLIGLFFKSYSIWNPRSFGITTTHDYILTWFFVVSVMLLTTYVFYHDYIGLVVYLVESIDSAW